MSAYNPARKNVLLVIPDLGAGGAERAISRLSVELSNISNIYLCRFTSEDTIVYPYRGELVSIHERKMNNSFLKPLIFISRVLKLKKIKKQLKIDISISFLEGANYINVLSGVGDRIFISLRGSIQHDKDIHGLMGFIRKKILIPWLYKKAYKIIALSEGLKHELIEEFGIVESIIEVIYNHYDTEELMSLGRREVPFRFQKLFEKPVIVMAGRLHQQKGHREFLDVFAQLKNDQDVRLMIFGDGNLRNKLLRRADNLKLKSYASWRDDAITSDADVYFMGYVKDPFHFISKSTVFVFPSLYEGLGNVLVEALACGITTIASDCHSGPREILSPGSTGDYAIVKAKFAPYGILMPVLDNQKAVNEWVILLKNVLQDASLRNYYALKGATRLKDFDVSKIIDKWRTLLEL